MNGSDESDSLITLPPSISPRMRQKPKKKASDGKANSVVISPRKNVFKELSATSFRFSGSHCPSNLEEQKQRFLRFGISPQFQFTKGNVKEVFSDPSCQQRNRVSYEYYYEAKAILDKVKDEYGDGSHYLTEAFGPKITCEQANQYFDDYIANHGLSQEMTVYWAPNLSSSAKMMWTGPHVTCNRPEARRWSLIILKSADNVYLTEYGIKCLADHEIGSHYFRMYNDGFQPWFSARKKFRIRALNCRVCIATEEGLASINTVLQAQRKYLYNPALLYYVACKAQDMTFKELFDHLEEYVSNKDHRWKMVMRVKRCLQDVNTKGGSAQDQTYFEGAAEILKNVDDIDFKVLFSGRICLDEVPRIRRMARLDTLRFPLFLQDLPAYIHTLKMIAFINGLGTKPTPLRKLRKSIAGNQVSVLPMLKNLRANQSTSQDKNTPKRESEIKYPSFPTMVAKFVDPPVEMLIASDLRDEEASSSQSSYSSQPENKAAKPLTCCGGGPLANQAPLRSYQRLLDRPATQIYNFPTISTHVKRNSFSLTAT